jgi:hypothetical protein
MTRTERNRPRGILLIFFAVTSFLVGLNILANRSQAIDAAAALAMTQVQLVERSIDSLLVVTDLTPEIIAGATERGIPLEEALRDEFLLVNHVSNAGIYDPGGALTSTLRTVDRPPETLPSRLTSPNSATEARSTPAVSVNRTGDPIIMVARKLADRRTAFAVVSSSYISCLFRLALGRRWTPFFLLGRGRFLPGGHPVTSPGASDFCGPSPRPTGRCSWKA